MRREHERKQGTIYFRASARVVVLQGSCQNHQIPPPVSSRPTKSLAVSPPYEPRLHNQRPEIPTIRGETGLIHLLRKDLLLQELQEIGLIGPFDNKRGGRPTKTVASTAPSFRSPREFPFFALDSPWSVPRYPVAPQPSSAPIRIAGEPPREVPSRSFPAPGGG